MKINPIVNYTNTKKAAFKGYTLDARTPWGTLSQEHLSAAMGTGRPYEKTLDSFHSGVTGLIYYADPMEQVSDYTRESVDYVFYDLEPPFPDINKASKSYFSDLYVSPPNETSFYEELENFRQYFYRLEMADRKTLSGLEAGDVADYYNDRIRKAQYNQETMANCQKIDSETFGLFDIKTKAYFEIGSLKYAIKERKLDIPKAEKELEQRTQLKQLLEDKINTLKAKQTICQKLNEILESNEKSDNAAIKFTQEAFEYNTKKHPSKSGGFTYTDFLARPISTEIYQDVNAQLSEDNNFEQKEKEAVLTTLKRIKKSLNKYTKELENNTIYLKKVEDYLKELPTIIKNLENELSSQKSLIEKTKAELIPHFDRLKNYMQSRGVQVIK